MEQLGLAALKEFRLVSWTDFYSGGYCSVLVLPS